MKDAYLPPIIINHLLEARDLQREWISRGGHVSPDASDLIHDLLNIQVEDLETLMRKSSDKAAAHRTGRKA